MQTVAYFKPPPVLRPWIGSVFVARTTTAFSRLPIGAMIPQINWLVAGRLVYHLDAGPLDVGQGTVVGAMTAARTVSASAGTVMVGANILPGGWVKVIREAAAELTDLSVSLDDLGLRASHAEPLHPDGDDAALVAFASHQLLRMFDGPDSREVELLVPKIAAVSEWVLRGHEKMGHLSSRLGLSERQVSRLVAQTFGLPAGLMKRKYRVLQVAEQLAVAPSLHWLDAGGDQFFDQSHFIRDFRRFVGLTPGAYCDAAMERNAIVRERWARDREDPLSVLG